MKMDNDIFDEIRKAMKNNPFPLIGAIAFGSRVKGMSTPHSDFDLLVAAEKINPKRQRRGEEILQIKRCLPFAPFDIILLSSKEIISNFRNHNPVFLDIAEDGIVILDRNDFLYSLIRETKDYIRKRGLSRWRGGWRFPVEQGSPAYLSKVTNKDFAMAMLKDGERDFIIAGKLMDEGFYDKSVYHSQQSVEKCMKAILIALGFFQKTHFVGKIMIEVLKEQKISELWKGKLTEVAEISESIEPEVTLSRYPGIRDDNLWLPVEEYEKEDAENASGKAEKVALVTKDFLKYWFGLDNKSDD